MKTMSLDFELLTEHSIERRRYWIEEIAKVSGTFGEDAARIDRELTEEIKKDGLPALLDHLHLCGAIPEHYGHDSSAEKLYSKYTDALLAATYRHLGLTSLVLPERADSADVEAVAPTYSLVADAKAFRLSRTAKNQKDFKIDALHTWKREKPHAMIVCPVYHLPTRSSQIYLQAITNTICVFSYSHMAVLAEFAETSGKAQAQELLLRILNCTEHLNRAKDSIAYWTAINRTMLDFHKSLPELWKRERQVTVECISAAKEEALTMLAKEQEAIIRMSREEAIATLIGDRNLSGREKVIQSVCDNEIFGYQVNSGSSQPSRRFRDVAE